MSPVWVYFCLVWPYCCLCRRQWRTPENQKCPKRTRTRGTQKGLF